ncbi:cystathionine beta-lyase [Pseudonocardia sp. EC080610-09]|uniref:MalY/PatB family protein n=1 Tax=unclassified Pseudonocardia TaxID=2619320 RepID=UPI0006CB7D02|nr:MULTISPECIES: aminotransferase class I/II-fold pyridoxal phosphate-dependent enzyme [unclassified Pseudonocardia]ALE72273.1 cystathionine beta-lyase [Pseudonocardia sp. EC080625-04]ALL75561.1 cystathionine beta-lyase [Pseudonocardia sp. EC080610-09]ALL82588.1 cystathionine beta-lyase [Pseudonocardia sp. EC080619-01]
MDPLEFPPLSELRRRTSMKWRTYDDDVLPLWVAEADVGLAPAVVDAVTGVLRRGDTGYPAGSGYAEAFARFARDRWGWDLDPRRALVVPDVMQGAVETLRVVAPDGGVVVTPPVYPPFHSHLRQAGLEPVPAPLTADGRLDPDTLATAFARPGVGAFLLCSPHNPTGTVHTAAELAVVAELARRHGVTVVADEIHAPLVDPGTPFTPWLTVPGAEDGVALLSASKGWNLAGLKAAIAVVGPEADPGRLPAEILEVGASHVAVHAHVAALDDGRDWLDGFVTAIAGNRALLGELLDGWLPDVRYRPGAASFLAWLDCRALGLGDDPAAVFLERGRVALNAGLPFGAGGAGHARLNLATHPDVLTEAVRRMAGALR